MEQFLPWNSKRSQAKSSNIAMLTSPALHGMGTWRLVSEDIASESEMHIRRVKGISISVPLMGDVLIILEALRWSNKVWKALERYICGIYEEWAGVSRNWSAYHIKNLFLVEFLLPVSGLGASCQRCYYRDNICSVTQYHPFFNSGMLILVNLKVFYMHVGLVLDVLMRPWGLEGLDRSIKFGGLTVSACVPFPKSWRVRDIWLMGDLLCQDILLKITMKPLTLSIIYLFFLWCIS